MTLRQRMGMAWLALAVPLAACDNQAETPARTGNAETASAAPGVTRDVVEAPAPPPAPAPVQAALQSQPGPDGSQVDLLKVAVTGDILTVTMRCSSAENINTEAFNVGKISVIDDATSQRIGVLKDNAGNWMASNVNGSSMMVGCQSKPGVLWAKFPAPPPTSQTVSITLPEVAPFDGVPVTR